jgi:hypothetical protein
MCGIVGIVGDLEYKDEATMKRLLLLDWFRGTDSTGFSSVQRYTGDFRTAKLPGHPLDLFDMGRFKSALSGSSSKVFLGHNRAATRGVVNTMNAHPFECGHILGAHNGTLDNASTTRLEDALGEKFGVDSLALFTAIERLGLEEAISLIEEGDFSTTGAWSLAWYDASDNTFNLLRNKHRPMWIAYSKDFKRLFYGSEYLMLDSAIRLSVNGYDMYQDKKGNQYWATEPNIHYRWSVKELIDGGKEKPKPRAKEIKGREPVKVVTNIGTPDPFHRQQSGNRQGCIVPGTTTNQTSTSSNKVQHIHLMGDIMGVTKNGCSYCQKPLEYGDLGLTLLGDMETILCAECSGHADTEEAPIRVYADETTMDLYCKLTGKAS